MTTSPSSRSAASSRAICAGAGKYPLISGSGKTVLRSSSSWESGDFQPCSVRVAFLPSGASISPNTTMQHSYHKAEVFGVILGKAGRVTVELLDTHRDDLCWATTIDLTCIT